MSRSSRLVKPWQCETVPCVQGGLNADPCVTRVGYVRSCSR